VWVVADPDPVDEYTDTMTVGRRFDRKAATESSSIRRHEASLLWLDTLRRTWRRQDSYDAQAVHDRCRTCGRQLLGVRPWLAGCRCRRRHV